MALQSGVPHCTMDKVELSVPILDGASIPLQKAFKATFTFDGKPFIELRGDFQENTKIMRGLLHSMHVYLKKRDNESLVKFVVNDPEKSNLFGLMCLSPALKSFYGFCQSENEVNRKTAKGRKSAVSSTSPYDSENDTSENTNEPSEKKVRCEDSKLDFTSCYEPDVVLDEDLAENGMSCEVFSKATFEPDQPSGSGLNLVPDSENKDLFNAVAKPLVEADDVDKYFESVNEKKRLKVELKRAKARERERLVPRRVFQPPKDELISKRIILVETLFASKPFDEKEKERLTALFTRNRVTEILVELKNMTNDPGCTYKCMKCDVAIQGKDEYSVHHAVCCPGPVLFYCLFCEQVRTEEEMVQHLRSHFYDDGCRICDIISIKSYMQHRDTHLPPERFPGTYEEHQNARFTCRVCESQEKVFKKDRDHYRRHLIWSHANPGQCEVCGLQLISHSKLRFHRRSAHHVPHHCKTCGEFIATYTNLRRHSCGSQTRVCEICGKVMKRHQMNRHVKEVHDVGAKKTYPCDFCDATFPRRFPLKQHMNIHLGDKPYICLICNKSHTSLAALGGHTRSRHDMTATEMRERAKNGDPEENCQFDDDEFVKEEINYESIFNDSPAIESSAGLSDGLL